VTCLTGQSRIRQPSPGFPDREVWVERLRDYEQQLETELANVKDVIERLAAGDAPEQPGTA